jgi:membrane protease YdiL (CAAX protease family)
MGSSRRELASIRVLPQGRLAATLRLERGARWVWLQPVLAVVMIGCAWGLAAWSGRPLLTVTPALEGPRPVRVIWCLCAAGAAATGIEQVQRMLLRANGPVGRASRRLFLSMQSKVREPRTWVFLCATVLGAFAEELLFRGALVPFFSQLEPLGSLGALFGSALLFGGMHYSKERGALLWPVSATVFGLVLGAIFLLTGELIGPIVAHIFVNTRWGTLMRAHQSTGIGPPNSPAKRSSQSAQAPK